MMWVKVPVTGSVSVDADVHLQKDEVVIVAVVVVAAAVAAIAAAVAAAAVVHSMCLTSCQDIVFHVHMVHSMSCR